MLLFVYYVRCCSSVVIIRIVVTQSGSLPSSGARGPPPLKPKVFKCIVEVATFTPRWVRCSSRSIAIFTAMVTYSVQ